MLTVVPAYGRDYTSAQAVKADWEASKDFRIADISCPDDGRYVNRQDCKPGEKIRARYKRLTEVVIFSNPKEEK
jgi:hypothetical protein